MRAIILKQFGGYDSLVIENLPAPVPKAGSVLIEVKAFGINHAETHMRKGEWAEAATVSGIECVGLVKSCPGGEFEVGTKVTAFMGGLGRTINGSYAEYTCPPATNVVAIKTDLSWEELAVIPESYATAWTCLHRNRSWIKWPQGFTKQSRLESFNLTRFGRRTRRWNRIKPMVKWWFASEGFGQVL